jgi:hypothetical protein
MFILYNYPVLRKTLSRPPRQTPCSPNLGRELTLGTTGVKDRSSRLLCNIDINLPDCTKSHTRWHRLQKPKYQQYCSMFVIIPFTLLSLLKWQTLHRACFTRLCKDFYSSSDIYIRPSFQMSKYWNYTSCSYFKDIQFGEHSKGILFVSGL